MSIQSCHYAVLRIRLVYFDCIKGMFTGLCCRITDADISVCNVLLLVLRSLFCVWETNTAQYNIALYADVANTCRKL